MNKLQEALLDKLRKRCNIEVFICGSNALKVQGNTKLITNDLNMCIKEKDFDQVSTTMWALGAVVSLDNPNSKGFDLRRQYKLEGEKYDFFLVGDNFYMYKEINNKLYVTPEIVWAARGYYASKGSTKYNMHLVEAGIFTKDRIVKRNTNILDKITWFLRGLFNQY